LTLASKNSLYLERAQDRNIWSWE